MEWEVNKSNADGERRQLNRVLDEIEGLIGPDLPRGDIIQGANVTLTGNLEGRLVGAGDITVASTGGGGAAWDFDEGDSAEVYGVGTIDFDEGDST